MRIGKRALLLALGIVVVPAIGACDRDAEVEEEVPASTETMDQVRVTGVELGRAIGADLRVSDETETDAFEPTDTIYVSVDTEGAATGATLTARWTYEDGQVVDESTRTISPTGPNVTEFHISKPDGFPAGSYQVEILLDGRSVETEDFEVR
jgi:hypothetical protein